MSARIIPYMRRTAADEFQRRLRKAIFSAWAWITLPVYLAALCYLDDEADDHDAG